MEHSRSYLMDGCEVMAFGRERPLTIITPTPAPSSCNRKQLRGANGEFRAPWRISSGCRLAQAGQLTSTNSWIPSNMSDNANQPRDKNGRQTSGVGALSQLTQHNADVAKNQKAFKKANKPIQRKLKKQAEHKHRSDGARKAAKTRAAKRAAATRAHGVHKASRRRRSSR